MHQFICLSVPKLLEEEEEQRISHFLFPPLQFPIFSIVLTACSLAIDLFPDDMVGSTVQALYTLVHSNGSFPA